MLTQLSTVKARLQLSDTTYDDILTKAIVAYSDRFDTECNRQFARQENATQEFHKDARQVLLTRYPVESVGSIEVKRNETDGWIMLSCLPDYLLCKSAGILTMDE